MEYYSTYNTHFYLLYLIIPTFSINFVNGLNINGYILFFCSISNLLDFNADHWTSETTKTTSSFRNCFNLILCKSIAICRYIEIIFKKEVELLLQITAITSFVTVLFCSNSFICFLYLIELITWRIEICSS